ncbi:saccharopine dehydrogenase NADP-binding domain-containing protein [Mycolicibacterium mucogenicum]|uniref:saccharopine dehydrogenase family protein n=1 Tax=Mycolicibacterium mucogenicum TaxID=56689 RepID=UPI00226AAB60|nr:saccharopine dehydrogenase NADP-binding domain-containing protein [Mycolicibacterium mucogenicum]MCX8558276.1 saccharopine dehydrogenase NADP-binding domain-containing protein [Mycolicibacterium mucogenicum]
MTNQIIVFGATGYTGGLVTEALVRRGVRPVLAGRGAERLAALAQQFGGLDYRVADVGDPASVRALVDKGDVLVTTVGPFEQFGHPVAQAAADAGAHYLDSTGEVGFVREVWERHDARARAAGAVIAPAFGYDYVPGILAGALAARAAATAVHSIDVGYFAIGSLRNGLSQGTRKTMAEGLILPAAVWRDGRLVDETTAHKVREFTVRGKRQSAFLVSGTEVLFLPSEVPELQSVTVYNGWFPPLSRGIQLVSAVANATTKLPRGRDLVNAISARTIGASGGPDAAERARTLSHVVAVARDQRGTPVAEVHVEGPSPYSLTGELMAWAAERLASGAGRTPGVVGPVEAFGLDELVAGAKECGMVEV